MMRRDTKRTREISSTSHDSLAVSESTEAHSDQRKSTTENANAVSRFCPCGCGRKMDPRTGLFFPIRGFDPMGHKAHTKKKR